MVIGERELLQLKSKIDTAKSKVSELKGRREYLMLELSKKWACEDIDHAKERVVEMGEEIDKLDARIAKGVKRIEEQYTDNGS